MYADDTKIYRTITNGLEANSLQKDIDNLVGWADRWQMKFNAEKCSVMHLGRNNKHFEYEIRHHGGSIKNTLNVTKIEKDLGVLVDNEMKFSQHVQVQVGKANKILGLIRRSFTYLNAETMRTLFSSLVRPHLEFSNTVWYPHFEKDKKLIENVLRRATKIIPGMKGLSYEERLKKMKLPSMAYRRIRGDMIETYKFIHGIYAVKSSLFTISKGNTRGHLFKVVTPRCETSLRQHFLSQRPIERWNNLPELIPESPDLNTFKCRYDLVMKDFMYQNDEPPIQI